MDRTVGHDTILRLGDKACVTFSPDQFLIFFRALTKRRPYIHEDANVHVDRRVAGQEQRLVKQDTAAHGFLLETGCANVRSVYAGNHGPAFLAEDFR